MKNHRSNVGVEYITMFSVKQKAVTQKQGRIGTKKIE